MELVYLLIGLAGLILLIVGYSWYVSIISHRNTALEALSGVDVQLKKRSNLIPNILAIAQKFMDHEKNLMQEITSLRTKADAGYNKKNGNAVAEHLQIIQQLENRMGQLMVQVEAYPDLKSNQTMLQAQQTYNEVEAQIAAARRFYNSSVKQLNTSIQIFPGNIIANIVSVTVMPYYEADEAAKAPVSAYDFFNK